MIHQFDTPESSMLHSVAWVDDTLSVNFKNGKNYTYASVPFDIYIAFKSAESHGRHYNQFIKGQYEKLVQQ